MQINGSNSNSLLFQPSVGKQANRNANVIIDVKPIVVETAKTSYQQYEATSESSSDAEAANYIRTFASQTINASATNLPASSVQPLAIIEYQKVDSISLNDSGRIIDEVV